MIVTNSGIIIRMSSLQISTTGRVAQGVKLINLKGDQKVSTVETIEKEETEEDIQNEDLSINEATKENNTEE